MPGFLPDAVLQPPLPEIRASDQVIAAFNDTIQADASSELERG
jgi:hypothetical protein